MFGTNCCGLRSNTGNIELCTWIMIRCPCLNVCSTSCSTNGTSVTRPATIGLGVSNPSRQRARMISLRTICW